ncbi:MAG: YbaK/EbsC family protein [Spirochaetales bacterium]|nr:YbaK/EbsC family protein [Spirochaetales bacterium]
MIPADIKNLLEQNNLKAIEFEDGSTPTAVTAAEKLGVETGQIAKSILLKGKNSGFYLVVCAGDKRVSTAKLKTLIGTKTRMATREELFQELSFKPGEVCPFRPERVAVFIDKSLEEFDLVYPAAGTDSSGVPVTYEKLIKMTGAGECDVTG